MIPEEKNTKRTFRLKEILKPHIKPHILYVFCVFLGLFILIFAYWPLITRLRQSAQSLSQLQSELHSQHSAVSALKNSGSEREMIQQNGIPQVIVGFTEKGRELGLNFSSISQMGPQQTTQPGVLKLPINFMIESEYKNLGQFLIYIEELPRIIAEIEKISIQPSRDGSPILNIILVLDLYVETENET